MVMSHHLGLPGCIWGLLFSDTWVTTNSILLDLTTNCRLQQSQRISAPSQPALEIPREFHTHAPKKPSWLLCSHSCGPPCLGYVLGLIFKVLFNSLRRLPSLWRHEHVLLPPKPSKNDERPYSVANIHVPLSEMTFFSQTIFSSSLSPTP